MVWFHQLRLWSYFASGVKYFPVHPVPVQKPKSNFELSHSAIVQNQNVWWNDTLRYLDQKKSETIISIQIKGNIWHQSKGIHPNPKSSLFILNWTFFSPSPVLYKEHRNPKKTRLPFSIFVLSIGKFRTGKLPEYSFLIRKKTKGTERKQSLQCNHTKCRSFLASLLKSVYCPIFACIYH